MPGYITRRSVTRARNLLGPSVYSDDTIARALGRFATETKDWITPVRPTAEEVRQAIAAWRKGNSLRVHGMTRIAFDECNVYVNGRERALPVRGAELLAGICASRRLTGRFQKAKDALECVTWMAESGAFEIPEQ